MQLPISETELAVLKVLWDLNAGTVREVQVALKPQGRKWAYTTVQTLLNRLQSKGYAASDKSGQAHVYRAAVSREQLIRRRLGDLADEFCEGTASPLVLALVEGGRFTPEEIEQFRQLLDQLGPRKKGR
jgi:BlaI family transcriptional regulator, penicillinase repressor